MQAFRKAPLCRWCRIESSGKPIMYGHIWAGKPRYSKQCAMWKGQGRSFRCHSLCRRGHALCFRKQAYVSGQRNNIRNHDPCGLGTTRRSSRYAIYVCISAKERAESQQPLPVRMRENILPSSTACMMYNNTDIFSEASRSKAWSQWYLIRQRLLELAASFWQSAFRQLTLGVFMPQITFKYFWDVIFIKCLIYSWQVGKCVVRKSLFPFWIKEVIIGIFVLDVFDVRNKPDAIV